MLCCKDQSPLPENIENHYHTDSFGPSDEISLDLTSIETKPACPVMLALLMQPYVSKDIAW